MAFIENAPEQIVAAAKELLEKGLVEGTSGNISARMEDGNIAVTPSSLDYRLMTADDIVIVNPAGDVVSGERGPTSEKYLHLAVQSGLRGHRGVHPLARRARHHVRRRPPGHPELHRRVHRLPRRRHPLHGIRSERLARSGRAGGQGSGEPQRGAHRQPRHGGDRHDDGEDDAQHGAGRAVRQDHLGSQAARRHLPVAREGQRAPSPAIYPYMR